MKQWNFFPVLSSIPCTTALLHLLLSGLLLTSCVPHDGPPPRAAASVQLGYPMSPFYYDGHAVYYDHWGRPIYIVAGVLYYVPSRYPRYVPMVRYYRTHREHYRHHRHPPTRRPRRSARPRRRP